MIVPPQSLIYVRVHVCVCHIFPSKPRTKSPNCLILRNKSFMLIKFRSISSWRGRPPTLLHAKPSSFGKWVLCPNSVVDIICSGHVETPGRLHWKKIFLIHIFFYGFWFGIGLKLKKSIPNNLQIFASAHHITKAVSKDEYITQRKKKMPAQIQSIWLMLIWGAGESEVRLATFHSTPAWHRSRFHGRPFSTCSACAFILLDFFPHTGWGESFFVSHVDVLKKWNWIEGVVSKYFHTF